MTLRLNGNTSGYTEIDAPAVAGNNTVLLPASNGSANQFLKNTGTAGTLGWSSMVEDSSGNVALGTTPSTGSIANSTLEVKTKGHGIISPSNGDINFVQNAYYNGGYLYANTNFAARYQLSDANHLFFTAASGTPGNAISWVERARITNAGILQINATTISGPTGQLYIEQDAGSIRNLASFNNTASGTGSTGFINFSRNGTATGNISNTGSATAYNTSSDYRLKENIEPVTDATDRIKALKPARFNFTADPEKTVDGFIAHEVQEVVPEAITGEKDAVDNDGNPIYQSIDQSKLVPLLTAALQEAITKIETLEASNADLAARLTALEAQS